jgi:hypothetical protein
MESLNYYATVFSSASLSTCPENTSSNFSNLLAKSIDSDYPLEVGLASLTYWDKFNPTSPNNQPIPVKPKPIVAKKSFFNGDIKDASVEVTRRISVLREFFVKSLGMKIHSFVTQMDIKCKTLNREGFEIKFEQEILAGKTFVNMFFTDHTNRLRLELSDELKNILGFKVNIFKRGAYRAAYHLEDTDPQLAFSDLNVNDEAVFRIWDIEKLKLEIKEPEEYDIELFGDNLTSEFLKAGMDMGFLVSDEGLVEINMRTTGVRFNFSKHLNRILNLNEDFEFDVPKVEFRVSSDMIVANEIIPLPEVEPTTTKNHLLVLTNLVEPQRFGCSYTRVLRSMTRRKAINEQIEIVFDPVWYLPLERQEHRFIKIQLSDENFNLISPSLGPTYATLHVRRAKF